jgi:glycerol transport system permease protein
MGYVNSLIYVLMNTVISVTVALPAAYAFSRYTFLGDKHLFFWLLTNRMARRRSSRCRSSSSTRRWGSSTPTSPWRLAHCLFNVPLAVWILEGFMRGVPREIDETAYIDGYSFPRFFVRIFMPLIASGSASRPSSASCSPGWSSAPVPHPHLRDAKPIAATMTRTVSASGLDWGCSRRPGS